MLRIVGSRKDVADIRREDALAAQEGVARLGFVEASFEGDGGRKKRELLAEGVGVAGQRAALDAQRKCGGFLWLFTYGAPEPWELLLILFANAWKRECSRKRYRQYLA